MAFYHDWCLWSELLQGHFNQVLDWLILSWWEEEFLNVQNFFYNHGDPLINRVIEIPVLEGSSHRGVLNECKLHLVPYFLGSTWQSLTTVQNSDFTCNCWITWDKLVFNNCAEHSERHALKRSHFIHEGMYFYIILRMRATPVQQWYLYPPENMLLEQELGHLWFHSKKVS